MSRKTNFNDIGVTSDVTGQVKVSALLDISRVSSVSLLNRIGAQNSHVKRKQNQLFGVNGVYNTCKHHTGYF